MGRILHSISHFFCNLSQKKIISYSILILVVSVSFLFSPEPKSKKDYCGIYIKLSSHIGFTFNCDAGEFCTNARTPFKVLEDSAARQSRPLFILIASLIGHPLQWVTEQLNLPLFQSMEPNPTMYVGYYITYIIINFITLLFSLLLFDLIAIYFSGGNISNWMLFTFQLLLTSNEITKTFFWTAHQQFFSMFTPLLTIWLSIVIIQKKYTLADISGFSLLCGILMLMYGNFPPMFFCLLLIAFLTDKQIRVLHLVKNIGLFLLPTLIWMGICIYKIGRYYNHEVEIHRQLIWIADALQVSNVAFHVQLLKNIYLYAFTFKEILIFISIAICAFIYMKMKVKLTGDKEKTRELIIITAIAYFLFFMLLGFYMERLTYTLFPICLCAMLFSICQSKQLQKYTGIYIVLSIIWHLYTLLSYGPFT